MLPQLALPRLMPGDPVAGIVAHLVQGMSNTSGTLVGGNLMAEIIFSYPGIGLALLKGVTGLDYPLVSASALVVTVMVLSANFIIEILYGIIDPRIKAAQADGICQIINQNYSCTNQQICCLFVQFIV